MDGCPGASLFLQQFPAGGAFCLVADEDHVVFLVKQSLLQVGHDPSAGAHAAAGDDDGRALDLQQLLVVAVFVDGVQALEVEGVVAFGLEMPGLLVPVFRELRIDPGDFQPQGGIDEDRDPETYSVQLVEQFLGPAEGEGGNIDDAFIGKGFLEQVLQNLEPAFSVGVDTIAVGGFQDEQVAGVGRVGVREDRGISAAQVAGEEHSVSAASTVGEGEEDETGAENVAGVLELEGYAVFQCEDFVEFEPPGEVVYQGFEVLIAQLPSRGSLPVILFPVAPPLGRIIVPVREGHGVTEHGEEEGLGGMGTDDLAPEAGLDQVRHPADVVDMGVGEEEVVDIFGRDGKPVERQLRIIALGSAAVDQDVDAVRRSGTGLDEVAGAGDTVLRAEMGDFQSWHSSPFLLSLAADSLVLPT